MIDLSQHLGLLMMLLHVYYLGKAYFLRQTTSLSVVQSGVM